MSDIAQRIANLPPEKRALLERRLMNGKTAGAGKPAILRRGTTAPCPLSFPQQRLWFFEQFEPGSLVYTLPVAVNLMGPLDVTALEQSLNEVVRRHEALRTTFVAVDGSPVQIVAPALTLPLPVIDLRGLPVAEREHVAWQRITEEIRRPFELAQGPLLRATALLRGEQEQTLLLVMHHIVSDGWSMGVLFHELGAFYRALTAGKPSPLPELPIQYPDFALWQRQWLQGEPLAEQLSYWKRQLDGAAPVLDLPPDRPRPALQTYRGARQSLLLPPPLTQSLRKLSRQAGATLFMTLLAAFQTLLSRSSGQNDIIVGVPISGRDRTETEGLIGLFVNTLALRADLSGDPTFRQLLEQVRETALGAYAHADLPFERLVEELHPERDLSRQPLFQVWFKLQNFPELTLQLSEHAPNPVVRLSELTLDPIDLDRNTAMVDLALTMIEAGEGLEARLEYNTDLFDAATMIRMLGHYQQLLAGSVANLEQRLSRLPLLTEGERQQILVDWNATQTDYPRDACTHHLFERQVRRTPDAVALMAGKQQLTYRELNARANQLAHYLQGLGVGPEVRVGLCVNRSPEMLVGVLGILKAGGAYVPLDPAYPPERLAFMLADSQAAVLLTQAGLRETLAASGAQVVGLDADRKLIGQQSEIDPISSVGSNHLAYVIYTSGSTGRPKGVAIEHRSTVAFLAWAGTTFTPEQLAGVLASTSLCFDLSVFELLAPLCCGGKVILAENVLELPRLPAAGEVTLVNTVPSAMAELLRLGGLPPLVRTVNLAGEPLPATLVRQIYAQSQVTQVIDLYGPSEDTTYSTMAVRASEGPATIGRPIANTQVYLLDGHRQPVPIGIPGELYLGGAGLARGYLNRPDLTAERFVPHPFSAEAGARLYKTGDVARYRPDGLMEFLGRRDQQVKLRGFRIELGEIEASLAGHPAVQAAVVLAREDQPGEKRLVAYVVSRGGADLPVGDPAGRKTGATTDDLRRFLSEKLPAYMVPAAFVWLEELTVTPTGKLDRRALLAPEQDRPEPELKFVGPRNPLELQLTKIWEQVLGGPPIGVKDNFFDRGGHSLLAVRLLAQIEQTFRREISLIQLFQTPTVEQLAALLCQEGGGASWSSLVPIQPRGSRPPLFCVHGIGGNVRGYRELARLLGPDQPVYGLQAQGMDGKAPIHTRIEEMAAHYVSEIRSLRPEGPYLLEGASFGGIVAFEMARQLHAQAQEVALLALLDSHGPRLSQRGRLWGMARRITRHLRVLRQLAPHAKLPYALARVKGVKKRVAWWLWKTSCRSSRGGEHRMPKRLEELQRIHRQAVEAYVPQRCPGRVTLLRARERLAGAEEDPEMGWGRVAAGGVEVHEVPGNHLSMLEQPHLQVLAAKLQECLQRAQAR